MLASAGSESKKTSFEALLNRKIDISDVIALGSKSFVHIPNPRRHGEFERRARSRYLVGYAHGNSYRVYIPSEKRLI